MRCARKTGRLKKTLQDDRTSKPYTLMRRQVFKLVVNFLLINHHSRFVWIDETGFKTHMTRKRGWSPKGKRVRFTCRRRSSPYTMICAMGFDSIICKYVFPKAMDEKRWRLFVEEHLLKALPPARIVFFDNLKIHKDEQALEMINKAGHAVQFTPPYSPECNPIEYMFSKLKTLVRKQCPNSAKSLRQAIDNALTNITTNDIAAYFFVAWGYVLNWS